MRVCLIGNAQASHLRRWAMAYRDAGIDTHVLSIRAEPINGVAMRTLSVGPVNSRAPMPTAASYGRFAAQARNALDLIAPDVVHAHYVTTSGVIARRASASPLVLSAWGSDVIPKDGRRHRWWKRSLIRYALRGADIVTTTSEYMGRWIEEVEPNVDLRHTPFGVDTVRFSPSGERPERPLTFGIAKSLEDKYGIEIALEAFAQIADLDAQLVVAGDGRLRSKLERQAKTLGLTERVRFLGALDHGEMPAFMHSIDVLVNPTVVPESFGVVVLEAQACGIPVLATDVGGIRETCIPEETAILVPPNDPASLAETLRRIGRDDKLRIRLGTMGRRFVVDRYRWENSVRTMIAILEEAAR